SSPSSPSINGGSSKNNATSRLSGNGNSSRQLLPTPRAAVVRRTLGRFFKSATLRNLPRNVLNRAPAAVPPPQHQRTIRASASGRGAEAPSRHPHRSAPRRAGALFG